MTANFCVAENRAVVRLNGPDARTFLQGIVSNDIDKVTPESAIWCAFLTPQGKYLHDFFVAESEGDLVLDCEADRRDDLITRLSRYKLRSKVSVVAEDGMRVALSWGTTAASACGLPAEAGRSIGYLGGVAYVDPRLADAGVRFVLPAGATDDAVAELGLNKAPFHEWDKHRLTLGLPDGSRDLEIEKTVLLEAGFHELSGVDWDKGCYMGQELTARTYYRGLLKRRLFPVELDGTAEPGTAILQDGKQVGDVRSVADGRGLALLRLDAIEQPDAPLTAGDATIRAHRPDWMILKPAAEPA